MIFLVIGAMLAVLIVCNTIATETSPWLSIGQRAFEIQNSYTQGDYIVSFMSSSARWASAKAFVLLGENGGFVSAPCGSSMGFVFWNKKDNPKTMCLPLAYESFYSLLDTEMANYVKLYAPTRTITIEGKEISIYTKPFESQYEYVVVGSRLVGIATKPVFVNIVAPAEQFKNYNRGDWSRLFSEGWWTTTYSFDPAITGTYIFRPNFEINFNYNLDVYRALGIAAQEIVSDCRSKASDAEKKACAEEKVVKALDSINEKPRTILIDNDKDIYYFTVSQDGRKTIYLDGKAPEIRFALALTP